MLAALQLQAINTDDEFEIYPFCLRVKNNTRNLTRCSNKFLAILAVTLDFLIQSAYGFLLLYYYFTQTFVNEPCRKAYFAFLVIYFIVTHLPKVVITLFLDPLDTPNQRSSKKYLGMLLMTVISLIQVEYLWIILFLRVSQMQRHYPVALQGVTQIIRLTQMGILVTQLTIMGINEVYGPVRIATVVVGCVMFLYNVPFSVVIQNS